MFIKKVLHYLLEGIYYLMVFSVLVPLSGIFLLSVYNNFLTSSISFTLDTLYLNWNTSFPAVTICEIYNGEKNWDISEEYFGSDRDYRVDDFVSEVTFFRGSCESCYRCDNMSCPTNFGELITTFRTTCTSLLSNCSWNYIEFECCDQFRPLITEYGNCFAFNSIQAGTSETLQYITNRETGPGRVIFLANEDIQIHVHPTNDIPFLLSEGVIRETVLWGSKKEIIFNVMEIFNDPSVKYTTPDYRNCRFENELKEHGVRMYRHYSYSTCVVECIREIQVEACGCHFFGQDENNTLCNISGLKCLSENYAYFNEMRAECDCMASCEEPEYNIVYTSPEESNDESQASKISISMIDLPTQRYVRMVVKTYLDFIISVGGIGGLFFGISFLSIIEVFYYVYVKIRTKIQEKKVDFIQVVTADNPTTVVQNNQKS